MVDEPVVAKPDVRDEAFRAEANRSVAQWLVALRRLVDLELGDGDPAHDVVPRWTAREEPVDGVTGKLVVDALAEARPGMTVAWTPAVEDGARFLAGRARAGDVVVTIGAGDVDRGADLVLGQLV